MNLSTRSLVLVTVCSLLGACSEETSGAKEPHSLGAKDQPQAKLGDGPKPKSDLAESEPHVLSATAPALPATILDKAPPPDEKPKLEETKQPTEPTASEPQVTIDYDRPLDAAEVEVDRFVLAHDVEGREPVDPSDVFTTDTKKIFAFVQLANKQAPYAFRVHWEKLDEAPTAYGVKLTVPTAERYRTWSWTAIKREPGRYKAVLRTLDGVEIASREFTIEAGEDCVEH